jgi:hypothetical protein
LKKPALPKMSVNSRRLKKVDPLVLNNRIQSCSLFSSTNLDELVSKYNTQLSAGVDEVAPLQTKTIAIRPPAPWYNDTVRAAKQTRRAAERRSGNQDSLHVHCDLYMTEHNKVTDLIAAARTKHLLAAIAEKNNDTKQLFRLVNSLNGRGDNHTLPTAEQILRLMKWSARKLPRSERVSITHRRQLEHCRCLMCH